ncbi:hypothetical protein MTO96_048813, partial [Rhipicephalus appendiculatus]
MRDQRAKDREEARLAAQADHEREIARMEAERLLLEERLRVAEAQRPNTSSAGDSMGGGQSSRSPHKMIPPYEGKTETDEDERRAGGTEAARKQRNRRRKKKERAAGERGRSAGRSGEDSRRRASAPAFLRRAFDRACLSKFPFQWACPRSRSGGPSKVRGRGLVSGSCQGPVAEAGFVDEAYLVRSSWVVAWPWSSGVALPYCWVGRDVRLNGAAHGSASVCSQPYLPYRLCAH